MKHERAWSVLGDHAVEGEITVGAAEAHTPTCTEALAAHVSSLRYEHLPSQVVRHARLAILDTVGAALFGTTAEVGKRLVAAVRDYSAGGSATVWGTATRTTAPMAALVNGTHAHAWELDDFGGCGHTGSVVVPAVLAVAEVEKSSSRDVLAAVVAGYEVAARITEVAGGYDAINDRGWHSTGICGSFAAAAGAASVMGLDACHTTAALGIAGSFTGGIWSFIHDGAMTKRLHPGKASENGVVAAYLARSGFTGPRAVMEAPWGGFLTTYMPGKSNVAAGLAGLGKEFCILKSGFKPYACCRGVHHSLNAFLHLLGTHSLTKEDIDRIEVFVSPYVERQLGKQVVSTVVDAQLSIPYSLAVALLSGQTGPGQFTVRRIADPEVNSWCQRIVVRADKRYGDHGPHLVRIHRKGAPSVEGSVPITKGAPENPMSDHELEAKFYEQAGAVLPAPTVHRLYELLMQLPHLDSIREVTQLLAAAIPRGEKYES